MIRLNLDIQLKIYKVTANLQAITGLVGLIDTA
jgi:hypothetical protein